MSAHDQFVFLLLVYGDSYVIVAQPSRNPDENADSVVF